jgi:PPOX class probable F420-dependent enzyme
MRKMTEQQWRAFATYGTRTGKLSTARADGSPHVTPVWFLLDGDDIVLTTEKNGVKGRNLARDGRFALCVDEDRPRTRSSSSKAARRSPKTRTT